MSDKIKKESIREKFRSKLKTKSISNLTADKNYEYCYMIDTFEHDPDRIDNAIEEGWEPVYSTDTDTDDRKNVPAADASRVPTLVQKKMKGNHNAILMKIPKDKKKQLDLERSKKDRESYMASAKRKERKIKHADGMTEIVSTEEDVKL
jgi:hypothetical protein